MVSMDTPPLIPSNSPLGGHTMAFVRDQLGLIDRGVEEVGSVFTVDVFGVGKITYCAAPRHVERILVTEHDAFSKADAVDLPMFTEGLTNVTGEQWERQREAIETFFFPRRIRSYTDEMVSITQDRLDLLAPGDRISLLDQMKALTLETVFGTLFDRRLDPEDGEELRQASFDLHLWFTPSMHLLPSSVPTPTRRRFERAVETIESEARRLLSERKDGDLGEDLLSALVERRRSGDDGLSDEELVDQVGSFIFAGHDTTALTLTYALHELSDHPDVRERFHAELAEVLGGEPPGADTLRELDVTERIIREAMRMYPPVHAVPRTTDRPVEFDGYRVPAGRSVQIPVYNLQNDERYYDDPDAFRPSRWRDRDPQSVGYAYVPFSEGPRACIGRLFALWESKVVLALIGQQYRIESLEPISLDPRMTLQPDGSVPAIVRER